VAHIREEPMHKVSMPEEIIARVVARVGRTHPFEKLEGWVTCHWHVASSLRRRWLRSGTTQALLYGSRIAITDVRSVHWVKADTAVASVEI
jgi:hypothetical protein